MIDEIRQKVATGQYEYSRHAVDQAIKRRIAVHEITEAIASQCLIIEDYPDDKYGPSCLIFVVTKAKRPLHIHCSYPERPLVKIITVYEPDKDLWIDNRVRRKT
ncbi:MAG: DUF4258 domain-containing protein [Desulfatirhabdiaceae bacterium]